MSQLIEEAVNPKRRRKTDEHELLQHEDFRWLRDVRSALSPYWSSRIIPGADGTQMIVIDGLRKESE